MLKVDPIKELQAIKQIKAVLKERDIRYYLLFTIGINAPLKADELVQLKVKDITSPVFRTINQYKVLLPDYLLREVHNFIDEECLDLDDYLFCSVRTGKPYTRQQFHRILSAAVDALELDIGIGIQSLKKTFAYQAYKSGMDINDLQHLLGHQSKKMTYHFIDTVPIFNEHINLNL
ncbi:integrase [Macrococcus hajekii]|uniref:Integrase n=1 Tax=Macrococcus hajekii TaxID=198482 RepID=A0A4R6BN52_9STAP|nr:tyrosine-type recombinase/integrase [Macrococcus hajekii]TDM03211.1 integrase [Macrococcus hajekii]GGA96917.1 recombinase [Macrococcus hajekii]